MESRIARLDLHATASADVLDRARRLAEPFARRVLARCDELLEQRMPGRCVVMRRLDTRWRLLAERLGEEAEVNAVAEALADGLEEELKAAPLHGSENVVAFRDEVEYRAEYLAAVVDGRADMWIFDPLVEEGPPPGALARSTAPRLAQAVLVRLAERGALVAVLETLDAETLKALELAIGAAAVEPVASTGGDEGDARVAEELRALASSASLSSLSPAARRILCLIEARRSRPQAAEAEVRAAAQRLLASATTAQANLSDPEFSKSGAEPSDRRRAAEADAIETRFGGLFYLLGLALELSIGEVIWKACLPENAFFTRVGATLIGPDAVEDAGPRLFGGASHDLSLNTLDTERFEEIAREMLHALVEALPRRGLAERPAVGMFVADCGGSRLLTATPACAPFPIFAWPAPSGIDIEEGIHRFLAGWPAGAPPVTAHPALAEADRTGRVRADLRAPLSRPLLLADDEDQARAATLTQAAGSLAYLFAARAGAENLRSPAALVERYLAVPARTLRAGDALTVRMPADRIDLALRRAGLDRDPGWVPWLGQHVRFEYEDLRDPKTA